MPTPRDLLPIKGPRPFIGRDVEIDTFWKLFYNTLNRNYSVLSFFGIGGIGKSRLQRELYEKIIDSTWSTETVISTVLDFDTRDNQPSLRNMERALYALRNELQKKGITFRAFDISYAHYWEQTHPETALQQKDIPFINKGSSILDLFSGAKDLTKSLEDLASWIVGAGMLPKALTLIKAIGKAGQKWLTIRAIEKLQQLNSLHANQLLDELFYFLAYDIRTYQELNPDERFIFFIDTYEALWWDSPQNRSIEHWLERDEWIRSLITELPHTLWIISGRNRLHWQEIDDWSNYIKEVSMDKLLDEDMDSYLQCAGINNISVRDKIKHSSQGIPFAMELQVDQFERILKTREPVAGDFTDRPEKLVQRFIEYLTLEELQTLKVISIARIWDALLFRELIRHFQTGYPPTAILELSQFSFIVNDDNHYRINNLVQEELQNSLDNSLKRECHEFLFHYCNKELKKINNEITTSEQEFAFEEALYHNLYIESIKQATHWFIDHWIIFNYGQYWSTGLRLASDLKEKWIVSEENIETEEFCKLLSIIGLILYNQSQYARALESHKQSLEICKLIYDENHLNMAKVLNDIGTTYNRLGSYIYALKFHQQALKIRQEKLEIYNSDIATSLNDIGVDYIKQGQYSNALEYLHQALKIRNIIHEGTHPETARTLNNIGNVYKRQGKYIDALDCHYQALKNRQLVLGLNHPDVAKSFYNISSVYKRQGKYVDALNCHHQALEIRQLVLGENHIDTLKSKKWVKYITFLINK